MLELPFTSLADALLVFVVVVLLVRGKRMVNYVFDAVAARLVKSINGALGLDGIRDDVSDMKIQIKNLEGQIEAKLTE